MLDQSSLLKFIFGRFSLDAFPIHEPILVGTFIVVATGGIAVFGAITSGTNVLSEILAAPASCAANPAAGTTDCLPIPNVVISSAIQTQ